jgi:hypothetical protein
MVLTTPPSTRNVERGGSFTAEVDDGIGDLVGALSA